MNMLLAVISTLILFQLNGASNPLPTKQEYERYLDQILMSFKDEKTREILKNATPKDLESGLIEKTLRKLHPDIRSKLDEVKRNIINEYRHKLRKAKMDDNVPDELYKFQDADLKHLIKERHNRLEAMDDQRKKQFLKYEMEKELKHRMALRAMNEYERKLQEALDKEEKTKMADREKNLKHPGTRDQLEEVWEKDGFDAGSFDPKVFFKMHDNDGDNFLDDWELMALFTSEVDKLFEDLEEDEFDEEEKQEELEMMAEHVKDHIDTNRDGLIHISEFIEYTKSKDFVDDDPWQAVFSRPEYDFDDSALDEFEGSLDKEELETLQKEADEERLKRVKRIEKLEDDVAAGSNEEKIKKLMMNENIKKAIEAANQFRKLEDAKKLVREAEEVKQQV